MTECLRRNARADAEEAGQRRRTSRPGAPVYRELLYGLVGLASASQNFDGNGPAVRYHAGFGDTTVSFGEVPGVGKASSALTSEPIIGSRPEAAASTPPFRPDVPCTTQEPPNLAAETDPRRRSLGRGQAEAADELAAHAQGDQQAARARAAAEAACRSRSSRRARSEPRRPDPALSIEFLAIGGARRRSRSRVTLYIVEQPAPALPVGEPDHGQVRVHQRPVGHAGPGPDGDGRGRRGRRDREVDLDEGRARVSMVLEPDKLGPDLLERDACYLRPRTGLNDMTIQLDPGTPECGRASSSDGDRVPAREHDPEREPRRGARGARRRHAPYLAIVA